MTEAPSTPGIPSSRIPGSVTFVAVAALIFAALGLLGSAWGFLGLITQRQAFDTLGATPAGADPAAAAVFEPMLALQQRLFFPTLAAHTLGGLAAMLFAAVGIVVLIRHRLVPTLVPLMLLAMAACASIDTGIALWIQHVSIEAMGDMFAGVASGDPSAGAIVPGMQGMLGLARVFSYGCAGGWLMLKLVFAGAAAMHLRSPAIIGLFGGPTLFTGRGD